MKKVNRKIDADQVSPDEFQFRERKFQDPARILKEETYPQSRSTLPGAPGWQFKEMLVGEEKVEKS